MRVVTVSENPSMPNPHGVDARKLYDHEHGQVVVIRLEPGQELRRHITPVDVAFYVLEGEGVVEVGDEQRTILPHQLVESPKDIPHRWFNRSEQDLRVLVMKLPRPTRKTTVL
jgi:quercetin dioxygenase-like cupin family protein